MGAKPRDPAVAVGWIQRFDAELGLAPPLLAARRAVMKQSPHAFYRANPALFYRDLSGPFERWRELLGRRAPRITVAGDPHLGNFGTCRGAGGGAVWGLNDFDQGGAGAPEWDLERLAASAVLESRRALGAKAEDGAPAEHVGRAYFEALDRLAGAKAPGPAQLSLKEARSPVKEAIARAAATRRKELLERFTRQEGKGLRFLSNHELRPVSAEWAAALREALGDYEGRVSGPAKAALPLRVLDLAERLDSGGSSFGLLRYYALVAHADPAKRPVILELKQLLPAPLESQDGDLRRADGRQVVACQRALGADLNPLTGFARIGGRAYLVREREPEKGAIDPEGVKDPKDFKRLCQQAAEALARSHAQEAGHAAALRAWVKDDVDEAVARLVDFARLYADQAEADWKSFSVRG